MPSALHDLGGGGGGGSGEALQRSIAQTAHGFDVGDVVYHDGSEFALALADDVASAEVVGIVAENTDANNFVLHFGGHLTGLTGLTAGTVYFLSESAAGTLTATPPADAGEVSKPLLIADATTSGYWFNWRGHLIVGGGSGEADPIFDLFGAPDTPFEFDTTSFTGLTALSNTPDAEDADTTVPGHYYIADDASGVAACGRYAAAPSAPFTAITKITDASIRDDFNGVGIFIGAGTPGAMDILFLGLNARYPHGNAFSNPSSFSTNFYNPSGYPWHACPFYLAVRVNSSTDVDWLWSVNGRIWVKGVDSRNPGFTIGSVGITLKSQNSGGLAAAFDFLRIWNSALAMPGST